MNAVPATYAFPRLSTATPVYGGVATSWSEENTNRRSRSPFGTTNSALFVGGAMFAVLGRPWVFGLDAVSFVVGAVLIATIRAPLRAPGEVHDEETDRGVLVGAPEEHRGRTARRTHVRVVAQLFDSRFEAAERDQLAALLARLLEPDEDELACTAEPE